MDSNTDIAKKSKTPRKAIVVCGRRQERQDGTLKRTKRAREEYSVIARERRQHGQEYRAGAERQGGRDEPHTFLQRCCQKL